MRDIVKELPEYDFVYLGDTARVPYGTRAPETVRLFTHQATDFLFKKNCAFVVLACNTASSVLIETDNKNILGIITPTAQYAETVTKNKTIGVIATERTVASETFKRELLRLNPTLKVFQNACPLLVPFIEAGESNSKACDLVLRNYLKPLIQKKIDTLILGCTHYGLLEKKIKKIVGKKVHVISEGPVIAKNLRDYLVQQSKTEQLLKKKRGRIFYSTDLTDTFKRLGSQFFGEKIIVQRADIL